MTSARGDVRLQFPPFVEVLVAVAEARHVTRAAGMLGLTQSAVSQHLENLESALETQLVDRSCRPIELTKAGTALHRRAVTILAEFRAVPARLMARLLEQMFPVIGDVRGRGLMLAIELVRDRRTREPDPETTARLFEETRRQGLVMSKSGPHRSILRMVPPLCLSMDDVDAVVEGLERSFAAIR